MLKARAMLLNLDRAKLQTRLRHGFLCSFKKIPIRRNFFYHYKLARAYLRQVRLILHPQKAHGVIGEPADEQHEVFAVRLSVRKM